MSPKIVFQALLMASIAMAKASASTTGTTDIFTDPPPDSLHFGWGTLATSMAPAPTKVAERGAAAIPDLTLHVRNAASHAVSVSYAEQIGFPGWVSTPIPADLAPGATTTLIAPSGWRGSIFVGPNYYPASQIEANLVGDTPNIDVSNVNAYSMPIVCGCGTDEYVVGCNKPLFQMNTCQDQLAGSVCDNPLKDSDQNPGTPATAFFEPCRGGTISYPNDDGDVQCDANYVVNCCIGPECNASVNQPA